MELVRGLFAAFEGSPDEGELARRFGDANLARFFDPAIEWVPVPQSLLASGDYRGYDGVRRFFTEFLSTWEEYSIELQEVVDAGDQVVAVMRMIGRAHEVEVDEVWSSLYAFRSDKIARVQGFSTPRGALEAAGLRE
jgi:ketosteroid isomerase-like protein